MFEFDSVFDRRQSYSSKWTKYGQRDVLPFWVADMDFAAPDFLLDAVRERLDHPILGYTETPEPLIEAFIQWADDRFNWTIHPDWLVWVHGVVPGLNLCIRSIGSRNDQILVPIPVYPPFLRLAENNDRIMLTSSLVKENGRWVMDFDELESKAKDCTVLAMCNPQNPTGRIYAQSELSNLAEVCVRSNTVLIADEIHWGLTLDSPSPHIPVASLDPSYAQNTITLLSHTKAYNIPGLQVAVAVIPNEQLREKFVALNEKLYGSISPLSYSAAIAAYSDRGPWLSRVNEYLTANRQVLQEAVNSTTNLNMTHVEGTYLGWLDASQIPVEDPAEYFEAFGVGMSPGIDFGAQGMVRFNFAAPREVLNEGLQRLVEAASCAIR